MTITTASSATTFASRVIAITGGSAGIGLASARRFAEAGAHVAIFGSSPSTPRVAAALAAEVGAEVIGVSGDVRSRHDLDAFMAAIAARFGRIDALFVNAGISAGAAIGDVDEALYDRLFDINVKGAFFTVQRALPHLNDGSAIVLTTSIVADIGYPALAVYSATKAALQAMTRSFAAELLPRRIRVNAVSPGPTATALHTRERADGVDEAALFQGIASIIPMKRMGSADEIASAVLFLASSASSFTTGTELVVDGGLSAM